MDRLLSLATAARMVGVSRRTLQQQIHDGKLLVSEGSITLSELMKEYPHADVDQSGMVERVKRIQENAVSKYQTDSIPEEKYLMAELHRAKLDLSETQVELQAYRMLTRDLKGRLVALHAQCDKEEKTMLDTLMSWFFHEAKQLR